MPETIPPWLDEIRAVTARVAELQSEMRERTARIEAKLDGFGDVKRAAYEAREMAQDAVEAIRDLQDDRKWVWRAVVGAWIAALADIVLRR